MKDPALRAAGVFKMIHDRPIFINEEFHVDNVDKATYDRLLADGWRHFGTQFFRYNFSVYRHAITRVQALRIRLSDFRLSKSQRRALARNSDLKCEVLPIAVTDEIESLFHHHKRRFEAGTPASVYDFLSSDAARLPTEGLQLTARLDGRLLAVSFFDLAERSVSAIYACFDPDEARRSLGIFTMLKVIEYATAQDKTFYYHGYAYEVASFYDYKKRFSGLEEFDWKGSWSARSALI